MRNLEIRQLIKKKRLFHWEVAKEIGISEFTFCKWLREELPPEKEKEVLEAIKRLTE